MTRDETRARKHAIALLKAAGFEASPPPPWDEPIPREWNGVVGIRFALECGRSSRRARRLAAG